MYLKRISDLHPLDAKTPKYYNPKSLWIETSQSMHVPGGNGQWEPTESAPAYADKPVDSSGNRIPATSNENLADTDAFVSRRCNLAELFLNMGDLYVENLTAVYADLDYISSYYIEGKGPDQRLIFNLPGGPITSQTLLTANTTVVTAANTGPVMTIDKNGAHIKNLTVPGVANLTAAAAYWADVAELYESDAPYKPGTLVKFGGAKEITIADTECNAVVTEQPAIMLNASLSATVNHAVGIVLTGRSKTLVQCPVNKFDKLCLSDKPGVACVQQPDDVSTTKVIGIALESNDSTDEQLIESVLQIQF